MSRALWFVAGAGAGVYATARVRRVARALSPEGIGDRLAGLSLGLHLFGQEVRAGMAEKETELRRHGQARLALHPTPELSERASAPADRRSDNSAQDSPADNSSATRESNH